jgi:hypothetical protein
MHQEHVPAEIIRVHKVRSVVPIHDLHICPVFATGSLEEIASKIGIGVFDSTPPQLWYLVSETGIMVPGVLLCAAPCCGIRRARIEIEIWYQP